MKSICSMARRFTRVAHRYHHLHEDTCFGNWVVGFDVKRLNLRAMTDRYYPNQKNLAGVSRPCGNHAIVQTHLRRRRRVDGVRTRPRHRADALPHAVSAERKRACARIMAQRYANGSAWDPAGRAAASSSSRAVCPWRSACASRRRPRPRRRARPAPVMTPASPHQASPSLCYRGACSVDVPCVAGPDLRAGLRRTSAKHVVVVFGGNVAPCLSSLRNELATRSGPLYAGAAPLRNAPLPASLEERTKLGVAPEHSMAWRSSRRSSLLMSRPRRRRLCLPVTGPRLWVCGWRRSMLIGGRWRRGVRVHCVFGLYPSGYSACIGRPACGLA